MLGERKFPHYNEAIAMIRRDSITADGTPTWVLISQIMHARLAGELARPWREPFAADVLATIDRHDDGWRAWERAPTIEPEFHRPRSFLEMPTAAAIGIWRASIDSVADLGPLAQYMVAEHFCRLRRAAGDSDDAAVHEFLTHYDHLCQQWLSQWQAADERRWPSAASLAVDWLQLFDRFSLWLCMAERTSPTTLALPSGESLLLSPEAPAAGRQFIRVAPWPWSIDAIELVIQGRSIPARPLASDQALHEALAAAELFEQHWIFQPAQL
jgi:hypothetical protein